MERHWDLPGSQGELPNFHCREGCWLDHWSGYKIPRAARHHQKIFVLNERHWTLEAFETLGVGSPRWAGYCLHHSGLELRLRAVFPGERAQEGEDLSLKVLRLYVTMAGCHILDGYLINVYEMNERKEGRNYTVVSEQTWCVFERNFRKKWKSNFST